jgi:hypothetical protein
MERGIDHVPSCSRHDLEAERDLRIEDFDRLRGERREGERGTSSPSDYLPNHLFATTDRVAVNTNLSNVMVVFDDFHVVRLFTEKLSDLRRRMVHEATEESDK